MAVKAAASVRLERKEAVGMDQLIEEYIREMKLSSGLNEQRVFAAWDKASGAGRYTISKRFKNGVLYCGIASSALRQQLYFQRTELVQAINDILKEDPLFVCDVADDGKYLKNIVLK